MNKCIFIFLGIISSIVIQINLSNAQGLIDHKLDVGFSIGMANGMEGDRFTTDDFTAPTLLNHMKSSSKKDVFASYLLLDILSIKIGLSSTQFSQWEYPSDNNIYDGISTEFVLFEPGIMIHTPWKRQGVFNRLRTSLAANAALGHQTLNYGIRLYNDQNSTISNNGFSTEFKVVYSVYQNAFVQLSYGIIMLNNKSDLSLQNKYSFQHFNIGLGFQLLKNKMYLYE